MGCTVTTLALTVGRTMLGLGALSLPSSSLDFGHISEGGRQWDKQFATSPFVHGRTLTSARIEPSTLSFPVYAMLAPGASVASLDSATSTLVEALSQFAYTLSLTATDAAGSLTYTWACEPADITPVEIDLTRGLRERLLAYEVSISVMMVP
jgi:hypothetical protein